MKRFLTKIKKCLSNQRGDIIQFIIVIAAVVAIALVVMPDLSEGIGAQGTNAVDRIGDLNGLITEGTVD
jgi:phosphotransferase system  glucose/maltose/N-acetylglucosamine-specific IIC component